MLSETEDGIANGSQGNAVINTRNNSITIIMATIAVLIKKETSTGIISGTIVLLRRCGALLANWKNCGGPAIDLPRVGSIRQEGPWRKFQLQTVS